MVGGVVVGGCVVVVGGCVVVGVVVGGFVGSVGAVGIVVKRYKLRKWSHIYCQS